jgi:type IV pilus assembly protein PilA
MILKLRQRMAQDESGFTLVELLVVMLILGLLAAIAIPAFFNQQSKAKDADAKSAVRTAETAMETFSTSNNGSYDTADVAALVGIEPTLNDAPNLEVLSANPNDYTVSTQSTGSNQNYYEIHRAADGTTTLSCGTTQGDPAATGNTPGTDGCPTGGNWGG